MLGKKTREGKCALARLARMCRGIKVKADDERRRTNPRLNLGDRAASGEKIELGLSRRRRAPRPKPCHRPGLLGRRVHRCDCYDRGDSDVCPDLQGVDAGGVEHAWQVPGQEASHSNRVRSLGFVQIFPLCAELHLDRRGTCLLRLHNGDVDAVASERQQTAHRSLKFYRKRALAKGCLHRMDREGKNKPHLLVRRGWRRRRRGHRLGRWQGGCRWR